MLKFDSFLDWDRVIINAQDYPLADIAYTLVFRIPSDEIPFKHDDDDVKEKIYLSDYYLNHFEYFDNKVHELSKISVEKIKYGFFKCVELRIHPNARNIKRAIRDLKYDI